MPANWSRTIGTRAVGGFTAPSIRTRALDGLVGDLLPARARPSSRAIAVREAGLGLVALDGERHADAHASVRAYSAAMPVVEAMATRDTRVADLREVDLRHARIRADRAALHVERQRHLLVGRDVGLRGAEELGHGLGRLGVRQHVELVGLRQRGVLPRARDRCRGPRRARGRRPTRSRAGRRSASRTPTPRDSANVRPSTSPRSASTSVRRDSSAYASTDSSPSAASTAAFAQRRRGQAPVPPTVIREMRSVGEPLPTGADCPSLPQTPSHVSKSSATASTALMTSIARPIRFAPRTGAPTTPSVDDEALAHAEHEVPGRRVHLAAAHRRHVHAARGAGEDVGGLRGAVEDVAVRHARHRRVRVGLAPAVAGARHAVLLRAQPVVQEPLQHALVEQHGALRGRALVVVAVGAPAVRRSWRRRRRLTSGDASVSPIRPAVHAGLLVDGVGLERVADGLVEEHAAAARAEHHRHLAGRRGDRVEHRDGAARGDLGDQPRPVHGR